MRKNLRLVLLLCFLQTAMAQQPTARLEGTVVADGANLPLAGALVELRSTIGIAVLDATLTDEAGRFYFPALPAGEYRLIASHNGYVTTEYGQRNSAGPALNLRLAPGQTAAAQLTMTPGGVISGRITDNGQPVGLADVVALKAVYVDGQLQTSQVLARRTDDLGEYRLFWLPPGQYYVVGVVWDTASRIPYYVTPDGSDANSFYVEQRSLRAVLNRAIGSGASDEEAHIPIYFNGTADPLSATLIEVRAGEEVRSINIDSSPRPALRVSGTISGPTALNAAGQPVRPTVRMIPLVGALQTNTAQAPAAVAEFNGTFTIPRVVPGRYMLMATAGNLSARVAVDVRDRHVDNVRLDLGSGFQISGQVVIDGTPPAGGMASLAPLRVVLRSDPLIPGLPTFTSGAIAADGTFSIPAAPNAPAVAAPVRIGDLQPAEPVALVASAAGFQIPPPPPPPPPPGTAQIAGPPAGEYRVLVNPILPAPPPPQGTPPTAPAALQSVYVKSIRMGQTDVLHDGLRLGAQPQEPLIVVLGTNPAEIEGRVGDSQGNLLPATWVALLPENDLRFRVYHRFSFTDEAGRFSIENVPPGDYRLFAWEDAERGVWQDPNFVRPYENLGTPIRIEEGARISIDLRALPPRN